MAAQLKPHIRPRYVASVEDRVTWKGPTSAASPDVGIHRFAKPAPPLASTAVMDTPLVVEVTGLGGSRASHQILDRYNGMRTDTIIEVVSPTNKAAGPGRAGLCAESSAKRWPSDSTSSRSTCSAAAGMFCPCRNAGHGS